MEGLELEKKDGGYGKMEEVEEDSHESEWHHVDESHSSSPHPPSYSPGEPRPLEDFPAIRYVFTRKTGERIHKRECMTLRKHLDGSLVTDPLCTKRMPLGLVSQDGKVGFSFEFSTCIVSERLVNAIACSPST